MARFCGHCGSPLDDDAKVCGQCGTPVDGADIDSIEKVRKKSKVKKRIKILIGIVLIIAIAISAIRIITSFTGPQGTIRKAMKAYKKYDLDELIELSSDMYYYGSYDKYVDDYFSQAIGESLDRFDESIGHNYKISYEITDTYKVSERKKDEMLKNIEFSFPNFDVETIQEIIVSEVKVKASRGSKSLSDTLKITLSKEGDSWKVLYIE